MFSERCIVFSHCCFFYPVYVFNKKCHCASLKASLSINNIKRCCAFVGLFPLCIIYLLKKHCLWDFSSQWAYFNLFYMYTDFIFILFVLLWCPQWVLVKLFLLYLYIHILSIAAAMNDCSFTQRFTFGGV